MLQEFNSIRKYAVLAGMLSLSGMLASCNTATKAVDNGPIESQQALQADETSTDAEAAEAEKDDSSQIIRQSSKVSQRGTSIKAIVNGEAITNYDINRRVAFLKLRRAKGGTQTATEELVDEAIKMQEAKRRRTVATDAQVNEAFANFAKGNKMKTSQLTQVLNRSGVTADHFKDFIRGQITWNRTVGGKFQSETRQQTTEATMARLRESGEQKPETNEYLLQQVIFVIPDDKRKARMAARKNEARAFRQRFQSCETTQQLAVGQIDVSVRNLPRILEPQLPAEWKKMVIDTSQGETTDILETDKGVEFLAICSKKPCPMTQLPRL